MKKFLQKILGWFPAQRQLKVYRGVYQYDEKLKKMVKVRETPRETVGKYAMPIEVWQARKIHKGSYARRMDKNLWDENWEKIFRGGGIRGSKLRQIGLWWKKIFGR